MTIQVRVYMPGVPAPVSLDDYVGLTAMVASCGMSSDMSLLPDFFYYHNPTSGDFCSIEPDPITTGDEMPRSN
jgi:hypothetical protein